MTNTTKPESKSKTVAYPVGCPACSSKRVREITFNGVRILECAACGGYLADHLYLGESYSVVLPYMTDKPVPPENTRYFDLSGVGSKGPYRRHGWFDVQSRLIAQVG